MTLVQLNTFEARDFFPLVFQIFIVHNYVFFGELYQINNLKTDSTVHKLFNSYIFNVIE